MIFLLALLCALALISGQQLDGSLCVDASPDCAKRHSLCHNNLFEDLMREQCRKTCNFCDDDIDTEPPNEVPGEEPYVEETFVEETTPSSVEESGPNGEESEHLPDPELIEVTTRPPLPVKKLESCTDRSYGCDSKHHLCHRPQYRSIMVKSCAKTCGFCGSNSANTFSKGRHVNTVYPYSRVNKPHGNLVCRDTSHDCLNRQHLCQNPQYTGLMKKLCRKTCNLC